MSTNEGLTVTRHVGLVQKFNGDQFLETVKTKIFNTEAERNDWVLDFNDQVDHLHYNKAPVPEVFTIAASGGTTEVVIPREQCSVGVLMEYERGWGSRLIDTRLFATEAERNQWIDKFNRKYNPGMYVENPSAPDEYILATKG